MSCQCSVCYEKVTQPNSLWYAASEAKPMLCWVCGDCLARIPAADRTPTETQRELDITFGPVRADVNDRGNYQMSGARTMAPRFWVTADILERSFPESCELMIEFHMYTRLERRLHEMVEADREGVWPPWPWEVRSRDQILMETGHTIRKHLGLEPARKVADHPAFSITGQHMEVPPGQLELARELWAEIVSWHERVSA